MVSIISSNLIAIPVVLLFALAVAGASWSDDESARQKFLARRELPPLGYSDMEFSEFLSKKNNELPYRWAYDSSPIATVGELKQDTKESTIPPQVSSIEDQVRLISLNNPEYRMVGPNRSEEVLMGDDVASKLVVALDNMQEEAKELWSQVSTSVDDQWSNLKKMIERQLDQAKSQLSTSDQTVSSLRKLQSTTGDIEDVTYANADGDKPKNFLNNIGITNETQQKASEYISNAGTSIKEVAQKDIPEAFEKAKSAVSEAVTKDIPNYWNKLFGNKTN